LHSSRRLASPFFLAGFSGSLTVTCPALRRVGMHAAALAAGLVAAQFALEPARMAGAWTSIGDTSLWSLALGSPLALTAATKLAGLALIIPGPMARSRHDARIALLGALITLLGFTLVGHTAGHSHRA
jgi:hypothetical protein